MVFSSISHTTGALATDRGRKLMRWPSSLLRYSSSMPGAAFATLTLQSDRICTDMETLVTLIRRASSKRQRGNSKQVSPTKSQRNR